MGAGHVAVRAVTLRQRCVARRVARIVSIFAGGPTSAAREVAWRVTAARDRAGAIRARNRNVGPLCDAGRRTPGAAGTRRCRDARYPFASRFNAVATARRPSPT